MNEHAYVSYDLRSAQRFIFRIPLLQAVVGGSGLIVEFDRAAAERASSSAGVDSLFVGAGHGLFRTPQRELGNLTAWLIERAHESAIDIRVGTGRTPEEALRTQKEFPYLPGTKEMSGPPCYLSGLYPFDPATARRFRDKKEVNERVYRRIRIDDRTKAADLIDARVWQTIEKTALPKPIQNDHLHFFRVVTATQRDEIETQEEAERARAAMGGRNRWAVICMDGNSIGRQFEPLRELKDENARLEQRRRLSEGIDRVGRHALAAGIVEVLNLWVKRYPDQLKGAAEKNGDSGRRIVVPLRPLIAGGDDLVVLCHPALAFDFVVAVCEAFTAESIRANEQHQKTFGRPLWAATRGRLTTSAGIAFTSVTFPLHLSIPFAEELLASAKAQGQKQDRSSDGDTPPPCLDWDSLTEGLVDGLAERRCREYTFVDEDLPKEDQRSIVTLTARPYLLEDFRSRVLETKAKMSRFPRSILIDVLPSLREGFYQRKAYRLRLGKHQPELARLLNDKDDRSSQEGRPTWLNALDAIDIYLEAVRMDKELTREDA